MGLTIEILSELNFFKTNKLFQSQRSNNVTFPVGNVFHLKIFTEV